MSLHDNGVAFAQWDNRPFCRARKVSIAKAKELKIWSPRMELFTMPRYREPYAQVARDMIALGLLMDRARVRLQAAMSNAERQARFRAKKADQECPEVRGIYAHKLDHAQIKTYAAKVTKKRAKAANVI